MTAGIYLSPPVACERLENIVRRYGGERRGKAPVRAVEYSLPAHATGEMRAYFQRTATGAAGESAVSVLPGGRIFGSGIVLSPDGSLVARDVSEDFGRSFETHWLLGYGRIRAPETLDGMTTVVAVNRGSGYSHWLLEELPRMLSADLQGSDRVVANLGQPFAAEAIRRHGFLGTLVAARRTLHVACERLIVPGLAASAGFPTEESVGVVRDFAGSFATGDADENREVGGFGEKLYLSRERAHRRRVSNDDALWSALEPLGFRRAFLENLSWPQQMALFRRVRVVVAPHGAGLANLVFCEPGTRVVELFNRRYVNPCFWRLASIVRADYRPVVAAGEQPLAEHLEANREDIAADIGGVLRALKE